MTRAGEIAGLLRPIAPDRKLAPEDVPLIDKLAEQWESRSGATGKPADAQRVAARSPTILRAAPAFYGALRGDLFSSLDRTQVDGLETILAAMGAAGWPIAYAAYGLATAYHETNHTMQPVREAYWVSEDWRKAHLRYWPHYGRGYVQLTWPKNYERADTELGLGGALVKDLDLAMKPDIAAKVMVRGMEEGWFTQKKLGDYLPSSGPGNARQFTLCRYIINGTDKAAQIADHAMKFQDALSSGGWA